MDIKNHFMFKYSKDGVSVLTILDIRRIKINGLFPVKIQVVLRRKQKYYSTGKELSKEDWDRLLEAKNQLLMEVKADIESSFSIIRQQVSEFIQKREFSFEILSIRLGRHTREINLRTAFELKMRGLEDSGQVSTYLNYQSALKSLECLGGTNIPLDRITVEWLKHCERLWISNGKNCSNISIYFRTLKYVLNRAVRDGVLKESLFPFGKNKYEIPGGHGRELVLTLPEVEGVMSFQDSINELEEFRDLWFFSYLYNGVNFMGLLFLQYSNIVNGKICFIHSKASRATKRSKEIRATITPEMWDIIHKWGSPNINPQTYIFKYAKGNEDAFEKIKLVRRIATKCSKKLKKTTQGTGIAQLITYMARHSFATVLEHGGTKTSYISESPGHSSLTVTENYLTCFEKEERVRNTRPLTNLDNRV